MSLAHLPIWLNLIVFATSGAVIWWAGTKLEHYAALLSTRTGMGRAFVGVLLLAAATSLPELATTITAVVVLNDATLAANNLLGGVAMQTGLLVIADAARRDRIRPLTSFRPEFQLLIQGVGLLLLICIVVAGVSAGGSPAVFSVSGWLLLLLPAYVGVMYLVYVHRHRPRWLPANSENDDNDASPKDTGGDQDEPSDGAQRPLSRLWLLFGAFSLVVLIGGWFATLAAEAVAKQSGLGSAFIGATLLAIATSLPELSTTLSATRRGHYSVAISNVFGSNAFDIALLVLADALFRNGTILAEAKSSMVFVAVIGATMTCVYVLGMLERADRTVLGIGWDSAIALVVYLAGMGLLYTMR